MYVHRYLSMASLIPERRARRNQSQRAATMTLCACMLQTSSPSCCCSTGDASTTCPWVWSITQSWTSEEINENIQLYWAAHGERDLESRSKHLYI